MALAVEQMSPEDIAREIELIKGIKTHEKFNQIELYDPYPFQKNFIDATAETSQAVLCAGNRVGKTRTGAYIAAVAATGLYPEWYSGRRFDGPVTVWCRSLKSVPGVPGGKLGTATRPPVASAAFLAFESPGLPSVA